MANWREVKRKALAPVHSTFAIPAVLLTHAAGTPVAVNVRHHPSVVTGSLPEWDNVAQRIETEDLLVFSIEETATVLPSSFVIFGATEAYLTGPSRPVKDGFFAVECSTVSQAQLNDLMAAVDLTHETWKVVSLWSQP